ncbi:MAG: hypothetical protein ACXADU_07200 [Promethearchaeota archaeon]|jgi:hypothetical protein
MEEGEKEKILSMIKDIEKKKNEIDSQVSSLSILSRNETLQLIIRNILNENSILREIEKSKGTHDHTGEREQPSTFQTMVNGFISKIQGNPTKKIIYLREFLENFPLISNNDKNAIINSLQDEEDYEILKEKMLSLITIFK